jgi:hypothetical protein
MQMAFRVLAVILGLLFIGFGVWFLFSRNEGAFRAVGAVAIIGGGTYFINFGLTGRSTLGRYRVREG